MKKKDEGFTLIETVIALGIILILTATVGLSASVYVDRAKRAAAKTQVSLYSMALQSYYLDCGRFPTREQGLHALWEKPLLMPVPQGWNGPYLDKKISVDPWGNAYEYRMGGSNTAFEILSWGADGKIGGEGKDEDILSTE